MERLEPFVSAAVTAGGFCLFGMLITIDQIIWEDVFKQKRKCPLEWFLGISVGICIMSTKISEITWAIGTTLCWGLIPIITQFVVLLKKYQKKWKKSKKVLDKLGLIVYNSGALEASESNTKKTSKKVKKVLDKTNFLWYNVWVVTATERKLDDVR